VLHFIHCVIIKCVFITFTGHSARLALFLSDIKNKAFPVKWNLNVSCFQQCDTVLAALRHSRLSLVFFAQNEVAYIYLYIYGLMSANMLHARVTGGRGNEVIAKYYSSKHRNCKGENRSAIQQRFSTKTAKIHLGLTYNGSEQIT
jgi:hypothetical protein